MKLSGWGRYPRVDCARAVMRDAEGARATVLGQESLIARGNGRSYGDASLNARCTLSTLRSDRLLAFDPASGRVTCEAGLLLSELLAFSVPRGWFAPVTPGTRFVTIGGMVAADVHGKNHHLAGTFGNHVESLLLLTADGAVRRCARDENADLLRATIGGMGLTGVILEVTFCLIPVETGAIRQETLRAGSFDEIMALCEESEGWTYTVAWIDCLARGKRLGRSLLYRGEHATRAEAPDATLAPPGRKLRNVPVDFPRIALNPWSMRAFNALYYGRGRPGTALVDYVTYFYPLDAVGEWNRIYGRGGFTQYQCVIPKAASRAGITAVLEKVSAAGMGSFLAVLKLFGAEGEGLLSFPTEGYTLTLDFPVDTATLNLLLELDAIVADHGGRLYLAKDSRTGARMMRRGYPRLDEFLALRERYDPHRRFESLQSQRLDL
ncbi:FAD-binding oxidoreductase [Roseomonas sp. NAR14]|uniref:FAD-binding oxidoreductase n=1 Tax=Roseomonas acroporae TaxID=2937791 RepID=A0A9X2BWM0_9PROT|nr:FAD-binding oxidoreductase [Roseomonas acroporae]MCK8786191.1 FAD-binding oxidoreductase [Roseomonas acroporae]